MEGEGGITKRTETAGKTEALLERLGLPMRGGGGGETVQGLDFFSCAHSEGLAFSLPLI